MVIVERLTATQPYLHCSVSEEGCNQQLFAPPPALILRILNQVEVAAIPRELSSRTAGSDVASGTTGIRSEIMALPNQAHRSR